MVNNGINISRSTLDELFKTDAGRKTEEITPMQISELKPYEEQPFKVLLDESMDELVESIKENGVLSPVVVRPHKDGGYEILSGHRRVKACEIAGVDEVPVVIKNLDDDTATILLVDSNLQRENILPSEKAKAYFMKLEAMKRKAGRPSKENSDQIGLNLSGKQSSELLAEQVGESKNQIQRYIRLNDFVDERNAIELTPNDEDEIILFSAADNEAKIYDFINMKTIEITEEVLSTGCASTYIDKTTSNISTFKVFVWGSLSDLTPLASSYEL